MHRSSTLSSERYVSFKKYKNKFKRKKEWVEERTWKREREQKRKARKEKGDCDECGRGEQRERKMLQKMKGNCREQCWELYLQKLWILLPTLRLNASFYAQSINTDRMSMKCSYYFSIFQPTFHRNFFLSFTSLCWRD